MVRILEPPNQFAEKTREAARSEFINANRNFNDASRQYRRIR
jgi:hypothetical protein